MKRFAAVVAVVLASLAAAQERTFQYPVSGDRAIVGPGGGPNIDEAVCPCYTAASMQALVAACSVGGLYVTGSCAAPSIQLQLYCITGPTNMGLYEAVAGSNQCAFRAPPAARVVHATTPTAFALCEAAIQPLCPPAVPTGFAVSNATSTSLDLSWNASAGAGGYRLERLTGNIVEVPTNATYTWGGLTPSTHYNFTINSFSTHVPPIYSGTASTDGSTTP
jgi:hypothetical protein